MRRLPCLVCGTRTRNRITVAGLYGTAPEVICPAHVMRFENLPGELRRARRGTAPEPIPIPFDDPFPFVKWHRG